MSNYCVCCGEEIPEGRMVCPLCEFAYGDEGDERQSCNTAQRKARTEKAAEIIKRTIMRLCGRQSK